MATTPKIVALNPQQLKFCQGYLEHGNAEKAALDAGYKPRPVNGRPSGSAILNQPKVQAYLRQRGELAFKAEHGSVDELIARAWRIVRWDPRCLIDPDTGNYKRLCDLKSEEIAGLRGMEDEMRFERAEDGESSPVHTRKYKFADPLQAITLLARIAKLLQADNHTTNIFVDLDKRLDDAQKRLERSRERAVVSEQTGEKPMVTIPNGR